MINCCGKKWTVNLFLVSIYQTYKTKPKKQTLHACRKDIVSYCLDMHTEDNSNVFDLPPGVVSS